MFWIDHEGHKVLIGSVPLFNGKVFDILGSAVSNFYLNKEIINIQLNIQFYYIMVCKIKTKPNIRKTGNNPHESMLSKLVSANSRF